MDVPSMVQRSGDTLIVRSVVSGDQIFLDQETGKVIKSSPGGRYGRFQSSVSLDGLPADMSDDIDGQIGSKDEGLPQCKIKRNYSCNSCTFFTQNPRYFLTHLRDVHGEKIVINECKQCLYASRHYQKLVRHMKMVHGSTEGIEDHAQARKRQLGREGRKRKIDNLVSIISPPRQPAAAPSPAKFDDLVAEDAPQNRLLKCSLCEFTTLYRAQLVEHERDEHCKTKFFRCEKCTYVTHIKARFSKHVKYHSMPMIKCVTCDFRTPYKWNLDRHMKNHGGTGPFKCAACNFTADIKQSLTVHEMNHHVPPVGHAAGMSMARRKNKVGGTDIVEDFLSENGDLEDSLNNNNNNIEDFDESLTKRYKYGDEEQPTDLSQKSNQDTHQKKIMRPVPNLIPIQATGNALNLTKHISALQKELPSDKASLTELASFFFGSNKIPEILGSDKVESSQLSPSSNSSTASKKKGANFFDRLKETLAIDAARNENLICSCGHTSKCLSESIIHRNTCQKADSEEKQSGPSPINLSVNSGSTRCQYCRHRCKSSTDLVNHIRNCVEAVQCPNDSYDSLSDMNERQEDDCGDESAVEALSSKHPMENRIFVWNKMPGEDQENGHVDIEDDKKQISMQCGENGYYGVETAPGYGEVTKKMTPEEEAANSSLKKVYKCPHCAFWASTASRFHVHIVGHLNKKPFECSFCAYRSNWRWDITKHIRLKTIRDPNHKIARVLMNDETGRRNYTKYNKYITLMKVTEEDGDPKLMKSGEMTPHQEASLALLNEYNNGIQKSKIGDNSGDDAKQNEAGTSQTSIMSIDTNRFIRLPFFTPSIMGMAPSQQEHLESDKRSPSYLAKPTEDLLTQNIDVKPDGSEKKTLYKCRKCNFRNPSRDMVLSHVKGHYQEEGINLTQKGGLTTPLQVAVNSNLYVNNVFAAMCLSQSLGDKTGQQQQHPLLAGSLVQRSSQPTVSVPQSMHSAPSPTMLPLNLGMATKAIEHGEADEASSGVVTTTGTGVTGWRSPAPYRCGHCHQVSNWKHVIQGNILVWKSADKPSSPRLLKSKCPTLCVLTILPMRHCRLKHNSDIRIETVDRNSNKNSPIYHPLITQPPSNGSIVHGSNVNFSQNIKGPCSSNQEIMVTGHLSTKSHVTTSSYDHSGDADAAQSEATEISDKLKQKHQLCPSCPFVSESKSQMNYHISMLHKNKLELYECQSCSFTTSKKQHLSHHVKGFHGDNEGEGEAMDLRAKISNEPEVSDACLLFCKECPARYIGTKDFKLHVKLHGANLPYYCKRCNYTTRQEHDLRAHLIMHTGPYQEKTVKLCTKFKISTEFPRPQLIQISNGHGDDWIVDRSPNSVRDVEDSIHKNIIRLDECNSDQNTDCQSLLKVQLESDNAKLSSGNQSGLERCSDCPFETQNYTDFKKHIQGHERISGRIEKFRCFACDFSASDEGMFKLHAKLHVLPIINSKSMEYYTSYKSLELNLSGNCSDKADKQIENLYKSDNKKISENGDIISDVDCSSGHRIILDATTGEIISRRGESSSSPGS